VDRPRRAPDWVVDQVFDLFDKLGATESNWISRLFTPRLNGIAGLALDKMAPDMTSLFETIVDKVAPPEADINGPFQMQISSLDYNSYVGVIGIGRISAARSRPTPGGSSSTTMATSVTAASCRSWATIGLQRVEVPEAQAGDIVCVTGMEGLKISDTMCDPQNVEALPPLSVDEPTVSMTFQVNIRRSPAGRQVRHHA
jgi:GTP-binding protein